MTSSYNRPAVEDWDLNLVPQNRTYSEALSHLSSPSTCVLLTFFSLFWQNLSLVMCSEEAVPARRLGLEASVDSLESRPRARDSQAANSRNFVAQTQGII